MFQFFFFFSYIQKGTKTYPALCRWCVAGGKYEYGLITLISTVSSKTAIHGSKWWELALEQEKNR